MIILNLKTYGQAIGQQANKLAEAAAKVTEETGVRIIVAPQAVDLRCVHNDTNAETFAQHCDGAPLGKFTGWISAEAVKDTGASGTVINHAEHQLGLDKIQQAIDACKAAGLETCVCADSIEIGEKIRDFEPDFIAIEVPELIGGDISIATANPEIITEAVEKCANEKTQVIAGAGIKTGEDVKIALSLGAKGIILASGVVKAENPELILREFAEAFLKSKVQSLKYKDKV